MTYLKNYIKTQILEGWGAEAASRERARSDDAREALHKKYENDPVMTKHLKHLANNNWKPAQAEVEAKKRAAAERQSLSEAMGKDPTEYGAAGFGAHHALSISAGFPDGGGAPIKNKGVLIKHFSQHNKNPKMVDMPNSAAAHEHFARSSKHGEMMEIHNNGSHHSTLMNVNGKIVHKLHTL